MPNVLVETRGGWLGAKRTAFLAAIQAATVEALRIPPHSLVLRLVEHLSGFLSSPRRRWVASTPPLPSRSTTSPSCAGWTRSPAARRRVPQRDGPSLRIYSDGIVLTTVRVSSGGLHSGGGFLGGSVTTGRSLGSLATRWSTWAPVA
jgi:hypothetical protein